MKSIKNDRITYHLLLIHGGITYHLLLPCMPWHVIALYYMTFTTKEGKDTNISQILTTAEALYEKCII